MAVRRVDGTYVENGETKYVGKLEFQLDYDSDIKPTLTEFQSGSECFVLESGSYFLWQTDKWVEV